MQSVNTRGADAAVREEIASPVMDLTGDEDILEANIENQGSVGHAECDDGTDVAGV